MKPEPSDPDRKTVDQLQEEARQIKSEMRQRILVVIEANINAVAEAKGTPEQKKAEAKLEIVLGWLEPDFPGLAKRYKGRKEQLGRHLTPVEFRDLRQAS